jgi:hypothetical protein
MIRPLPNLLARAFVALLLLGTAAVSVAAIPRPQRLPTYIKRIYVREFKNNSRWFGAQADLTLYVNDEFMLDGRLDVVQSERADVRLEGKIANFEEIPSGFGGDRFPLISTMRLTCNIELWDPYDSDRLVPIARYSVPTLVQYVSDPRRSISETQTEARDRLLRQAAHNIMWTVMQASPAPDRPIDSASKSAYNRRRGPGKYEPVVTEPRFPKPTPVSAGSTGLQETGEVLESVDTVTTTSTRRSK